MNNHKSTIFTKDKKWAASSVRTFKNMVDQ